MITGTRTGSGNSQSVHAFLFRFLFEEFVEDIELVVGLEELLVVQTTKLLSFSSSKQYSKTSSLGTLVWKIKSIVRFEFRALSDQSLEHSSRGFKGFSCSTFHNSIILSCFFQYIKWIRTLLKFWRRTSEYGQSRIYVTMWKMFQQ